jgi:hypothetical protein
MLWNGNGSVKHKGNDNLKANIPSTEYDRSKTTRKYGIYGIFW